METGKKIALGATAVLVLAAAVRVGLIYRERHEADKPAAVASAPSDPDDFVYLKKERPDSLKDARALKGRTLWVSAGGQLDFYPVTGHTVDYAKTAGTLLGADPIVIDDAVEQVAPKKATFRVPGGDKQVLLVFTKTGTPGEYAVPVGYREGTAYTFFTDEIFFYDDPHQLYKHWTSEIWKAVDEHRAVLGMNERQVQLALGQVSKSEAQTIGDRTVEYDNGGKPIRVTFTKAKATSVTPE